MNPSSSTSGLDDPGPGVVRDAVARVIAVRAGEAVAGDGQEDDLGVDLEQLVEAEPAPLEAARAHGLDDGVSAAHQIEEDLDAFWRTQIEHDAALAAVGMQEAAARCPRRWATSCCARSRRCGGSTLMTSAPMSANGPVTPAGPSIEHSMMRTPASGRVGSKPVILAPSDGLSGATYRRSGGDPLAGGYDHAVAIPDDCIRGAGQRRSDSGSARSCHAQPADRMHPGHRGDHAVFRPCG